MGRRLLRCQTRACDGPATILGRVAADDGLVLDPAVTSFQIYLDVRRAEIVCPACGAVRGFRGPYVRTRR